MNKENIKLTKKDIDLLYEMSTQQQSNRDLKEQNPYLLDTDIPLSDEELDEFLTTFADNVWGENVRENVRLEAGCEAQHNPNEPNKRCGKSVVGSVDFYMTMNSDAVLVCRDHVRFVYASIMTEDMHQDTLKPVLTINGKEIPRFPSVEQ